MHVIDGTAIAERLTRAPRVMLRKDDFYFDDALFADIERCHLPYVAG